MYCVCSGHAICLLLTQNRLRTKYLHRCIYAAYNTVLGNFSLTRFFPDISLTYISLTAVKFPDISRFSVFQTNGHPD